MGNENTVVVNLRDLPDAYERPYNKGVCDSIERVSLIYRMLPKDAAVERKQTREIGYMLCRMIGIQPGAFVWDD